MKTQIKKQTLILKLVEDDIDSVKQNLEINDVWWLGQILENGFVGYKNQSIGDLKRELEERGIEL
jgi:hypothetical protein